jgi:hypothetical protein
MVFLGVIVGASSGIRKERKKAANFGGQLSGPVRYSSTRQNLKAFERY